MIYNFKTAKQTSVVYRDHCKQGGSIDERWSLLYRSESEPTGVDLFVANEGHVTSDNHGRPATSV